MSARTSGRAAYAVCAAALLLTVMGGGILQAQTSGGGLSCCRTMTGFRGGGKRTRHVRTKRRQV